jgi:hypothetical protein
MASEAADNRQNQECRRARFVRTNVCRSNPSSNHRHGDCHDCRLDWVRLAFTHHVAELGKPMMSAGLAAGYAIAIGMVIAATGNWYLGAWLNHPSRARELFDADTGARVIYRRTHSLYWIPMHYWSGLIAIIAMVLIVMQHTGNYHPAVMH